MKTPVLRDRYDLAIVGAGPAGLAAAVSAARAGLSIAVVDNGIHPGGQYWRHRIDPHSGNPVRENHHDWKHFLALRDEFLHSPHIDYIGHTTVWMAEKGGHFTLHTVANTSTSPGVNGKITSDTLLLATGAVDRQLPIPGWDLPGVMSAGGVQAFLKTNGFPPGKQIVLAGTGPFLAAVGSGVMRRGVQVVAVLESSRLTKWMGNLSVGAFLPAKMKEAAGFIADFLRYRVPYLQRHVIVEIHGTTAVEGVTIARIDKHGNVIESSQRFLKADTVGLGWGFTPSIELAVSLGVETRVDIDGSLICLTDEFGQATTVPGLYLAGELTGVGGAMLAVAEGERAVAALLGTAVPNAVKRTISMLTSFSQAMHRSHPIPATWQNLVRDNTLVCRCEEVSAGDIRRAKADLGGRDARSAKLFTRAGMGCCQGRICGTAVAYLSADSPDSYRHSLQTTARRPLATPVSLETIKNLDLENTGPQGEEND